MKIDALTQTILWGICKGPKQAVLHLCFDSMKSNDAYQLLTTYKPTLHCIKSHHQRPNKLIQFTNGSIIMFRALSDLNECDIRGMRAHLMLVEEANLFSKQIWETILLPILHPYQGKPFIIS